VDKATKQIFLNACRGMLKNGPRCPDVGICSNLTYFYGCDGWISHVLVQHYAQNWPLHSGEKECPIPGGEDSYFSLNDKWEGEQGYLRYDLLRHLIKETEKDLAAIKLEEL